MLNIHFLKRFCCPNLLRFFRNACRIFLLIRKIICRTHDLCREMTNKCIDLASDLFRKTQEIHR